MPDISKKGMEMPASPIRKLVPCAEKAKSKGIKVYHLNIGQPDIPSPDVAIEAVRNFSGKIIEYGHSAGNLSYRKNLAEYYNSLGMNITHDNILITTGGSEALITAFCICLNPGDELIVPEPFYTNYNSFALHCDITIVPVATEIESGFALPSIEEFEKVITPKTKAVMLCNPNNPTGYVYSENELERIKELVIKYDLFLISDEVYREFCYTNEKYCSCMDLKGIENNVILIDSTSKRYSMCGIRIGALVSKNIEVIDAGLRSFQARLCAPVLGQIAAEAALKTESKYFAEIRNEYLERRNCLTEGLNRIPGVFCPVPDGAFYTIARLPVNDAEEFAKWLLEEFDYKQQTVMLAPAAGFYKTKNKGINEVRIAYVLKKADLLNSVECLKHALEKYGSR
ncbi:MAG: pyridoxal phosphate-dependent aminotransferase [Prevotellaceae bacterium]|jgi:aspartate aminotransferase|nr:pyridoxal phosphate-dependent aminotransferase [Prevotellaceae bacterium]